MGGGHVPRMRSPENAARKTGKREGIPIALWKLLNRTQFRQNPQQPGQEIHSPVSLDLTGLLCWTSRRSVIAGNWVKRWVVLLRRAGDMDTPRPIGGWRRRRQCLGVEQQPSLCVVWRGLSLGGQVMLAPPMWVWTRMPRQCGNNWSKTFYFVNDVLRLKKIWI